MKPSSNAMSTISRHGKQTKSLVMRILMAQYAASFTHWIVGTT